MTTPLGGAAAPPRLSFKAQMHRARELAIVEAASRLLGEKGFESMTLDEIAASVGIAKASLYKHFAGKDDLCAAAMAHGVQQSQAFIGQLSPGLSPWECLQALLRWQLAWQLDNAGTLALLAPRPTALAQALRGCSAYQQAVQELQACVLGWITSAQASGQLRRDMPAQVLLCAVLARGADPLVALLRECGSYPDAQIIDWAMQSCLGGLQG